ncbi:mannonate oxidoreductase [Selenomonas sp. TAMA-11512]|uniref:MutS-related protein n=1 Tax=Selenomonas sp. TAMA-11512 TaxID=3095337 RepID=UPI003085B015|nr:mannonate oxidoreductase [Selenomonas sp. TAMA-11512]
MEKRTLYDFASLKTEIQASRVDLDTKSRHLMWGRVVSFLLMLFAASAAHDTGWPVFYIAAPVLLLVFCLLLRRQSDIRQQQLELTVKVGLISDLLARRSEDWRQLSDTGEHYLRGDQPQLVDLAVFGKDSLYQFLSLARTKLGRDRLAASLSPFPTDFSMVRERQEDVKELASIPRRLVELLTIARLLPENDTPIPGLRSLFEPVQPLPAWIRPVAFLLPVLVFGSLIIFLLGYIPWMTPAGIAIFAVLLASALRARLISAMAGIAPLHDSLHLYGRIFAFLVNQEFRSPWLTAYSDRLRRKKAAPAIQELARLADLLEMRRNLLYRTLADLFLGDAHLAFAFLKWQKEASDELPLYLADWAELEAIASFAVIPLSRSTYCYPELLDKDEPHLAFTNLHHLLIGESTSVGNDFASDAATHIITGSNMSGKTTFLRTAATALILAYAGAPVPASGMSISPMRIYSSIRVADDAANGISTFYAELLRIKSMMQAAEDTSTPIFVVIDEIFHGTNATDRLAGAKAAILALTGLSFLTLLSTHDAALANLRAPSGGGRIINDHFEEQYDEEGKIHFDYKLRPGRSKTTNGRYLLEMTGILPPSTKHTPHIPSEK